MERLSFPTQDILSHLIVGLPFPTTLWLSESKLCWTQSQVSWGLSSWCQTPRLGSLLWGSDLSLFGGASAVELSLLFVGTYPRIWVS